MDNGFLGLGLLRFWHLFLVGGFAFLGGFFSFALFHVGRRRKRNKWVIRGWARDILSSLRQVWLDHEEYERINVAFFEAWGNDLLNRCDR